MREEMISDMTKLFKALVKRGVYQIEFDYCNDGETVVITGEDEPFRRFRIGYDAEGWLNYNGQLTQKYGERDHKENELYPLFPSVEAFIKFLNKI